MIDVYSSPTVIGIDYTPAYEQSAGIGRYVRELVNALATVDSDNIYRLFIAGAQEESLPVSPAQNFSWRYSRASARNMARLWHRLRLPIPVELWTGKQQLFHATDFVLPPTLSTTRTLLTVHDLSFVHLPDATDRRLKQYLDAVVPRSVRRADHVLADSLATKTDLITIYGTPEEKITVLYSGVGNWFQPINDLARQTTVRAKYGLADWPFFFSVGTVQPRKNYIRLCRALARLPERFTDFHLVIAGGKGWLDSPIYQAIADLGLEDRVHFIGFASDDDLPVLMSMAEAVPFVSLYEGFGLPVLEAMACGTPVVTSRLSSLPEVAGDAALLVDPTDVEAISNALLELCENGTLRAEMIRMGHAQAARFTWDHAARQLVDVYRGILSR